MVDYNNLIPKRKTKKKKKKEESGVCILEFWEMRMDT